MMSEEEMNSFYTRLIDVKMNQNCVRYGKKTRIHSFSISKFKGNVTAQLRCTFNKCKHDFFMWNNIIFLIIKYLIYK